MRDPQPVLVLAESGRVEQLESFPHYVARQMGIEDVNECPNLCKMAHDYLRRTKECEDNLFAFFANDPDHESLYVKLVEELDKCILGYFAFHWNHTTPQLNMRIIFRIVLKTLLIPCCGEVRLVVEPHEMRKLNGSLVPVPRAIHIALLSGQGGLHMTHKTQCLLSLYLKVTRVISTLVEEMKAIRIGTHDESHCTEVMVPAAVADRSPVLLLMGGGMGAGKSTGLRSLFREPNEEDDHCSRETLLEK